MKITNDDLFVENERLKRRLAAIEAVARAAAKDVEDDGYPVAADYLRQEIRKALRTS